MHLDLLVHNDTKVSLMDRKTLSNLLQREKLGFYIRKDV